jgi:AcrR family transcriptional regulator
MSGLRERKIAKTKISIQECALRLFIEQGYSQTTVEQIAEAADISPSTFFRYFHTKEAVVLYDSIDLVVIEAFTMQPPNIPLIRAMRNAVNEAYSGLTTERRQQELLRFKLLGVIPALRRELFAEAVSSIDLFARLIAEKTGKNANDLAVRNFAGALVGVLVAVILQACKQPSMAIFEHDFDAALAQFEKGLEL